MGSEPKPLSLSASQLWFVIGPCRWLPSLSRDRPQPPFLPRDVRFQQHDQRRSLRLGHVYRRAPRHTPRELRERFREHVLQMSLSQLSLSHPCQTPRLNADMPCTQFLSLGERDRQVIRPAASQRYRRGTHRSHHSTSLIASAAAAGELTPERVGPPSLRSF